MSIESKIASASANASWSQPDHYKLDGTDDRAFEHLLDRGDVTVHDPISQITEDMFELTFPDQKDDPDALREYTKEFQEQGIGYGEWVHFPWSKNIIRYPVQEDHLRLRTFRNQYLITQDEQDAIYNKTIAVFGMSVGSNITDQLVQSGIGNRYVIGDFDTLAPSNLNRIRSHMGHVGMRKVDIMARKISEVDPYIDQIHVHDGYNSETTPELLDSLDPNLIVEEIDDVVTKARIRQYAKQKGLPLVMAADVAERSLLHVERHDLGDVRPFNGRLSEDAFNALVADSVSDAEKLKANIRIVGMRNALASARFIDSNLDIGKKLAGIPQLGAIATSGAVLTDRGVREILLGRTLKSGVYQMSAEQALKTQPLSSHREHIRSLATLVRSMK